MRYLFLSMICLFSFNAYSTSDQYTLRTEIFFCKYSEGSNYDDVVKYEKNMRSSYVTIVLNIQKLS